MALMIVDYNKDYLKFVRSIGSVIVYPLQYVVNIPIQASVWLSTSLASRVNLLEENAHLKKEQLLLHSKLQRYAILEAENQRLHQLLNSSSKWHNKVLIAELIAVDSQLFKQQIVINKGRRDGAYQGQAIVDATGIMGQIIYADPFSSTVLLLTDSEHAIPVQVNRNGLRAIAVGFGQTDQLLLKHLPRNANIQEGDLIISSGLGGRFPSGYPVGEVEQIQLELGDPFIKVTVKPSAKLGQSREVLMVWPE